MMIPSLNDIYPNTKTIEQGNIGVIAEGQYSGLKFKKDNNGNVTLLGFNNELLKSFKSKFYDDTIERNA